MWSHARPRHALIPAALLAALALTAPPPPAAVAQAHSKAEKPKDGKTRGNDQDKDKDKDKGRREETGDTKPAAVPRGARLKEPVPFRVYQRGRDGTADIPVAVETRGFEDAAVTDVQVVTGAGVVGMGSGFNASPTEGPRFEDGKLVGVPTGGPYAVSVTVRARNGQATLQVENVFVGDLWVLAGQSNMEGVGDLADVTPPDPMVQLLGMDGKWARAAEPLHWLVDSPDVIHSGNPDDRAQRSAGYHRTRAKGAGLGLPFAVTLAHATGVPVGLVACAHGGTSMAQWDPAKKGEGGKSLYGSMLRQVKLAGGKVKGVLWYQGESDANADAAKVYPKVFADFIGAVRSDLGQPELPFYYVQIGRFIRDGSPRDWNAVQDAERRLVEKVPNTAVVATVDLELDDLIHVGTQGLKRVGRRLANVALREQFGQVGATTPTFDRVNKGSGNTLVVKFKGVNLAPDNAPAAGTGGMGGMGMQPAGGGGFRQVAVQGGMNGMGMNVGVPFGGARVVGLKPARHIAGFSIRTEEGTEIPLIFDAAVGNARDTVILKLVRPVPEKAFLWYGHGFDPYCNLVDARDMAVPVFGPIPLDDVR